MKVIRWNEEKNNWLKRERGVCFEQIVGMMEQDKVLEILDHPSQEKYPGQRIAIVAIAGYAYLAPYEEHHCEIELKTIIPSRKATKKYLGDTHEKDES